MWHLSTKRKLSLLWKDKTLSSRKGLTVFSTKIHFYFSQFFKSGSDDSDALEISLITDIVNPLSTIKESLSRIHEFTAPADQFDYSTFRPSILSQLEETLSPTWVVKVSTTSHVSMRTGWYRSPKLPEKNSTSLFGSPMTLTRMRFILLPKLISEWIGLMLQRCQRPTAIFESIFLTNPGSRYRALGHISQQETRLWYSCGVTQAICCHHWTEATIFPCRKCQKIHHTRDGLL